MKKILIAALILSALGFVEYIFITMYILPENENLLLFFLLILLIDFIIFFLLLKWIKIKYYSNEITFKKVFMNGMIVGIFSSALLSGFIFVFFSYIYPHGMEMIKKTMEEQSIQNAIEFQGSISAADKKSMNTLSPTVLALGSFSSVIYWLLFSLIAAPILKTKKPQQT